MDFVQVLVGGITYEIGECRIVEVYFFRLNDFSIYVDIFGGLGWPDYTIRSVTKVHKKFTNMSL